MAEMLSREELQNMAGWGKDMEYLSPEDKQIDLLIATALAQMDRAEKTEVLLQELMPTHSDMWHQNFVSGYRVCRWCRSNEPIHKPTCPITRAREAGILEDEG